MTNTQIQAMFGLTDIDLKQTRFYQQAVSEGEATLLLRQLEHRFGPLPATTVQRLTGADAETLLRWGERLLDAKTLDEVFGP